MFLKKKSKHYTKKKKFIGHIFKVDIHCINIGTTYFWSSDKEKKMYSFYIKGKNAEATKL